MIKYDKKWNPVNLEDSRGLFGQLTSLGFLYVTGSPLGMQKGLVKEALRVSRDMLSSSEESFLEGTSRGIYGFTHGKVEEDRIKAFRMGNEEFTPFELRKEYYKLRNLESMMRQSQNQFITNHWPKGSELARTVLLEYFKKSLETCEQILASIANDLRIDSNHLLSLHNLRDHSLESKVYPALSHENLLRFNEHRDLSTLTILTQDVKGGLEVMDNGNWNAVPSLEDLDDDTDVPILVNAGNYLEILSGGKCVSTPHRVFGASQNSRCSIAFFFAPNYNSRLQDPNSSEDIVVGDLLPFEM